MEGERWPRGLASPPRASVIVRGVPGAPGEERAAWHPARSSNADRLTHHFYQPAPAWRPPAPPSPDSLQELESRLAQPSARLAAHMEASRVARAQQQQEEVRLDMDELFGNLGHLADMGGPLGDGGEQAPLSPPPDCGFFGLEEEEPEVPSEEAEPLKLEEEADQRQDKRPVSDCRVCGDRAIAHMHYGGICCYSCKAFFRRAVQSGKDKVYRCKKDNNCQVTLASRRSCQRCRFAKCQTVGMTASWVLSEEQCTIRFGKQPPKGGAGGRRPPAEEPQPHPEPARPLLNAAGRYALTQEDNDTVEYIKGVYEASKETINFSENNLLLWDNIFNKDEKHDYSADEMSSLVSTVVKKNIYIMLANSYFKLLPSCDQNNLLSKNMTEMCHLRGALRFDVNNKSFQWYFNSKDQAMATGQAQGQAVITEGDIGNFYSNNEAAKDIVTNIERIVKTELPSEVILMMMHVVAFSGDGVTLQQRDIVSEAQVHYLSLIHRYLLNRLPVEDAAKNIGNVMALLVDLRECGERAASSKIHSGSLSSPAGASKSKQSTQWGFHKFGGL